jgi:hypothetical protein
MKKIGLLVALISLVWAGNLMAMEGMDHGSESKDGEFKHSEMAGDIHVEFKVMDLASMNMKDSEGRTHHVMATFMRDGKPVENVVGKVKLISPSGKEQLAGMKSFGSGIYAANFTIDEPGKWGVISLFKNGEGQHTVKFWYPHMDM